MQDTLDRDVAQSELLASIGELLERVLSDRREALCGAPFCRETWTMLGDELGLLGAALPEALGGMEAGAVAHGLLMEGFGRHLMAQPYVSSLVMASALLDRSDDAQAQWLSDAAGARAIIVPALADGPADHDLDAAATRAAVGPDGVLLNGSKVLVRDAPLADCFIVLARYEGVDDEVPVLLMVPADAPGITREDFRTIDGATGSHLGFASVRLAPDSVLASGNEARARAETAVDAAIVAVCAEALGVMQAMLAQTIEYARQRKQFGKPIASFQVLQHRMVDMSVAIEQAESITRVARGKLAAADRSEVVSAAMALVAKSCRKVAQDAVQIHGAIGIADETPISRYFRRALAIETQFGGREHHLSRYIDRSRRG
jgi:alkylation response protein AidB-like acyl-CoA dehydrogenase